MSIRRRKDGSYVIRYYADGTKKGPQRQETLRGVTYEEAVRIHEERLAAARGTPIRETEETSPEAQRGTNEKRALSPAEWRRFVRAFDDDAAWNGYIEQKRRLGPVKSGAGSPEPRRYGAGRRADSESTAAYRDRLRATLPVFRAALYTGCTLEALTRLTWGSVDWSAGVISVGREGSGRPKAVLLSSQL